MAAENDFVDFLASHDVVSWVTCDHSEKMACLTLVCLELDQTKIPSSSSCNQNLTGRTSISPQYLMAFSHGHSASTEMNAINSLQHEVYFQTVANDMFCEHLLI